MDMDANTFHDQNRYGFGGGPAMTTPKIYGGGGSND